MFLQKVFYALALALFASSANGAAVPGGFSKRAEGAIKLDFSITGPGLKLPSNLTEFQKRDSVYEYTLNNKGSYYIADLYVGSNSQKISVDVDTGSSDLWFIDSESGIEGTYGVYDHSSSSSYKYVADGFEVAYADGSGAYGSWVTDKVSLSPSGPTLDSLEFGDATQTNKIEYGILGIGFTSLESTRTKYDNLPAALKKAGIINKNAYSLYLGSADAATGSVLFGGIDNAKHEGDLVPVPIVSSSRLSIELESVTGGGQTVDVGAAITLDSGSTISYLPPDVVEQLASAVGASDLGDYYGWDTCDEAQPVSVNFNGVSITVPKEYTGGKVSYTDGSEGAGCALLFFADPTYTILGDNFLRNAYAVYDLDDKTISLAKVKYSDSEDIQVIS